MEKTSEDERKNGGRKAMRVFLSLFVLTTLAGCQKVPPSCFDFGPIVTAAKYIGVCGVISSFLWAVAICWRKGGGG